MGTRLPQNTAEHPTGTRAVINNEPLKNNMDAAVLRMYGLAVQISNPNSEKAHVRSYRAKQLVKGWYC